MTNSNMTKSYNNMINSSVVNKKKVLKMSKTLILDFNPTFVQTPIIFWKTDELFMVNDGGRGRVESYNLSTKKFRNLPLHGFIPGVCSADFYMKTLVSVKRGN